MCMCDMCIILNISLCDFIENKHIYFHSKQLVKVLTFSMLMYGMCPDVHLQTYLYEHSVYICMYDV